MPPAIGSSVAIEVLDVIGDVVAAGLETVAAGAVVGVATVLLATLATVVSKGAGAVVEGLTSAEVVVARSAAWV